MIPNVEVDEQYREVHTNISIFPYIKNSRINSYFDELRSEPMLHMSYHLVFVS